MEALLINVIDSHLIQFHQVQAPGRAAELDRGCRDDYLTRLVACSLLAGQLLAVQYSISSFDLEERELANGSEPEKTPLYGLLFQVS